MSNTTDMNKARAAYAVQKIAKIVAEAVAEAGPMGISEGSLYAMLMGFGCTLPQFEALVAAMVATGMVKKNGHLLTA